MYRRIINDIKTENWAKVRSDLANAISSRKLSKRQLHNIMQQLKGTEYYEKTLVFAEGKKRENNSNKWNQSYLNSISAEVVCGDTSEETVMHMFEVSDKIKWKDKFYVVTTVCEIIAIVAVIIAVLTFILRRGR